MWARRSVEQALADAGAIVTIGSVNHCGGIEQKWRQADTVETTRWGDEEVPVLRRAWQSTTNDSRYREPSRIAVGGRWADTAWTEGPFWSALAIIEPGAEPVPPEIAAAAELAADPAIEWAATVEAWGGPVLLDGNGVRLGADHPASQLVAELVEINGRAGGIPDVIALGADGRLLVRELKRRGKDRLGPKQHDFLRAVRSSPYGGQLEPAVIEWA